MSRSALESAGVAMPPPIPPAAGRGGRRPPRAPAPREPGAMGRWERQYAERLDALKLAGEVREWHFEACKLLLSRVVETGADGKATTRATLYTPDFLVILADGTVELHEVKGWMREDAQIKVRQAADRYPFTFRIARLVRKQWELEEIRGAA